MRIYINIYAQNEKALQHLLICSTWRIKFANITYQWKTSAVSMISKQIQANINQYQQRSTNSNK